ncbi:uncharacterized protein EV154DRAFT_511884 [Mucor mucedo]|uniref:uncharacterized protein n=1 Tax=Mucor mucedo TaxID=29922 RepID=UPI0022207905|nr:uncharacterized protein EV154DRAFT_511884 [Mucor mucedo]KAI7890210.1 hypothetical protein EV154DRAFT_511884 [Mucor mucedo]
METADPVMTFFHYRPSTSLAVMSLINFDFIAIYLVTRIYMSKGPNFLYMLPVIAFIESSGFVYRAAFLSSPSFSKFIIMTIFLMIPSSVLTLVNYITLGKIIKRSNVQSTQFFLNPAFVTWFFFIVEVLFFWVQRVIDKGNALIVVNIIGLSVHAILFTCFVFIALYIRQSPEYVISVKNQPYAKERAIMLIIVTSTLLFIRSIYTACLYTTGLEGPIGSTEWTFYIFDISIVGLCFALHCIFFIGDYLPKKPAFGSQYIPVSRFDNLDEDDMIPDHNKHIAVFNNVQSVNYSIGSEI